MNDFTASNGLKVVLTNAGQTAYTPNGDNSESTAYLGFAEMVAFREFFRAEEDERLGRWRWPADPRFVVYRWFAESDPNPRVAIIDEATGGQMSTTRATCTGTDEWAKAARAYFDAHPEPKPWHTAESGEVWLVTVDGHERPHYVQDNRGDTVGGVAFVAINPTHGQPGHLGINAPAVQSARRIYPEGDS